MRAAAFRQVQILRRSTRYITAKELAFGFSFRGEQFPLINRPRGIFKPKKMRFVLSVKTVLPRPGRRTWYDDQLQDHHELFKGVSSVEYSFMGTDPEAANNRWLREAGEKQIPFIYFFGVAPALYEPVMPTFVADWNPRTLKVRLVFGLPLQEAIGETYEREYSAIGKYPKTEEEKRYTLQTVKRRLHQSKFREALIQAYEGRCAISGIPEPLLIDAAHIVPDIDEQLGQPIVPNGIPLSKIHHAAFDSHLIGVDPDYRIHVSDRLLDKRDGPLLETLKKLQGQPIHLPTRDVDKPDPDRLAIRFDQYRSSL